MLSSVPVDVSVGLVIGALIVGGAPPRLSWETVPTGTGERAAGARRS
jgi:hypothetical protein